LIGPDGINKTVLWRNRAVEEVRVHWGTSHMRKRSLFGMPVPSAKWGFFFPTMMTKGDG
jgi:hypothetical protein